MVVLDFFCTRDYENWNHFIPIQIGAKLVKVTQLMYTCVRDKPMIKWFIKGFLNAYYKYILFELSIESVGKMLSALHDFNHKNIYFVFRLKWYHKKSSSVHFNEMFHMDHGLYLMGCIWSCSLNVLISLQTFISNDLKKTHRTFLSGQKWLLWIYRRWKWNCKNIFTNWTENKMKWNKSLKKKNNTSSEHAWNIECIISSLV